MFRRLVAAGLAALVLCLALAPQEFLLAGPATDDAAATVVSVVAVAPFGGDPALDDGSIDDHHLDDLPIQAQLDGPADGLGVPSASPRLPSPLLLVTRVVPHAQPIPPPPAIAAWLRPPRAPDRRA